MKTTNYKQFKELTGNRNIENAHLIKLTNSIAEKNLLEHFPILVTKKMEVIDGQHRLRAAKRLNIPIHYQVLNADSGILETQLLNANQRSWKPMDFILSYEALGNPNYKRLHEFIESYGLGASGTISLIGNDKNRSWSDFKSGKFEINERKWSEAVTLMLNIRDLIPYMENKSFWKMRDFPRAMKEAYKKVSHERIMEKLVMIAEGRSSKKIIEKSYTKRDYLRQIEDIVNWKVSKDEHIIRLFGN